MELIGLFRVVIQVEQLHDNENLLCVLICSSKDKCHQYWPTERSARYQYFVVDPTAEYNMPQYILREFKVTDARVGERDTVMEVVRGRCFF